MTATIAQSASTDEPTRTTTDIDIPTGDDLARSPATDFYAGVSPTTNSVQSNSVQSLMVGRAMSGINTFR